MAKVRQFEPMSAAKITADEHYATNWAKVSWPKYVQAKIDGIRCVVTEKGVLARSLKPIPNKFIVAKLKDAPIGLDGELVTYTNGRPDDFNTIQSRVMSHDGEPEFMLLAFDNFANPELDFVDRHDSLNFVRHEYVVKVPNHGIAKSYEGAIELRNELIMLGYEGSMLRDPKGPYKFGGSSLKEGYLIKMKTFYDEEAIVLGFEEEMKNTAPVTVNEQGKNERKAKKEDMVPKGTLGALICRLKSATDDNPITFKIGTGFDAAQRKAYWDDRDSYLGKTVTFSFQEMGPGGRPRFPVFLGFRKEMD